MRVCLITNLYPPFAKGGAERVVSEEARELRRQGHDVSVITSMPLPESGDPSVQTSVEDGVRVHRFYPMNLFNYGEIGRHRAPVRAVWHLLDLINPHTAKVVERLLRQDRPDVVHTHNLKGVGYGALSAIRKLKLRHVHTLHDVQLAVPSGLLIKGHEAEAEGPAHALYAAVMRKIIGSPDVIVSPSRFLLRFYEKHGFFPASQTVLLANPAPCVTAAAHVTADETRFLFLGQIEEHKGVVGLVKVLKKLMSDDVAARLEIVGVGTAMEEAVAVAGKERRIAFFGKKNPAQFAAMFANADFTVVPSLCYENAPTVVLESFAYGVPVIAADIGGAAELIKDGVNGFRFEAGNAKALAAVLRRACHVARERRGLRDGWSSLASGAARSAGPLTIDRHVERLACIYAGTDHALARHELVVPIRHVTKSRAS